MLCLKLCKPLKRLALNFISGLRRKRFLSYHHLCYGARDFKLVETSELQRGGDFVRNILSVFCVFFAALFLFVGCGIDMEANEKAGLKLADTIRSITSNVNNLDDESAQKFSSYATEIADFVKKSDEDIKNGGITSQEQIDEITKKYEQYNSELEKIAAENNINIEPASESE